MTFSRFFHHLLLFFLLCFVANSAKPNGFAVYNSSVCRPLLIEIKGLPKKTFHDYNSIIVDNNSRLFIATDEEVFIYEGGNYHKVETPLKPVIAFNNNNKVALAAGAELRVLNVDLNHIYSDSVLISDIENRNKIKFSGVGFGKESIYLTSGKKLWKLNETLKLVDSSNYDISIYQTSNGLVFKTFEKGFYFENGHEYKAANNILKTLSANEKVQHISFAGSYIFISTSVNRLLMYNNLGEFISDISELNGGLTDKVKSITTADDVTFFAITSNQILQFINPKLVEVFGENQNIQGTVNSSIALDGKLYVATSHALYKSNNLSFSAIEYGTFNTLFNSNNQIYTIGPKGLQMIYNEQLKNISADILGQQVLNQTFTSIDTLNIKKVIKLNSDSVKTRIGKTYSDQNIYLLATTTNPNIKSLLIENVASSSKSNTLLALPSSYHINNAFLDPDSTLWLSANIGLIRVSSDYIKFQKNVKPILTLSSIFVNDKYEIFKNDFDGEVRVRQGEKIKFILNSLGHNAWLDPTFSYKLDHKNSIWSQWTTDSNISFENFNPGTYKLSFKTRDAIGLESKELVVKVRVVPNFFQTKFSLVALIILVLIVVYVFSRWRSFYFALERFKLESIINRRTEELVKEKEKTDNLLERVLPRETASELKETGKVSTQKFTMATVLFSDIQGFTRITDELNPESLIDQLDKFFLYFDSVVDKYRIEKIKTIGDAYMCAGGIPHKNRTNPVEVVLAALEMLHYMREINLEHNPGQNIWDLRIGIDTGPVIAGVVGRNKLTYDIWGTTVNTASRMESSGEVGRINISGNTHIFIQDYFICTYRGKMPIKNKGDIEMYFIDGIKPALSSNFEIYKPNSEFLLQLQFLRFGDLEEFILEKLEKGLPKNLYYHNLKHTVDVYTQVELIGRSEDVTLEEQLLLQTAALFHDAGHLIDYDTHEEMGVKLAREILPQYQYSERQIQIISELILVTKLPPKPKNLLEAIMCDADLDYLGRTDFIPVSNNLYRELHEHGRIGTIQEWNEMQIKFIEKHQYFTETARKLRNVNKNSQLENIKNWIEKNKL